MTRETKIRLILYLIVTMGAFAFGRYSATMSPQTKKEDIKQNTNIVTHSTIVTTKQNDGTTKIVETIDASTKVEIQEKDSLVIKASPKINVSALVAGDITKDSLKPIYGVSINKEFLGPVTLGMFGLTNGIIGLSVGLNF